MHRSQRTLIAALALSLATIAMGAKPTVDGAVLEFELPNLAGEPVGSSDARFAGKVVLVDLWATWCPPCITEIPTLIDLQTVYGDQGLVVLAIAFEGEEDGAARQARLREFVAEQGINYLVLDGGRPEDLELALPQVRNVRGFPVEILIDRNGTVVSSRNAYGYKKKWARKLRREIEELLSQEQTAGH